jgi:hypothetical protein
MFEVVLLVFVTELKKTTKTFRRLVSRLIFHVTNFTKSNRNKLLTECTICKNSASYIINFITGGAKRSFSYKG